QKTTFIKGNATELESAVSHKMAGDKWLINQLLHENGIPVPFCQSFHVKELPEALTWFCRRNRTVVVKPRRGTSGGKGVTACISQTRDFIKAFYEAAMHDSFVLVEDYITGRNYRLLLVKDELLGAVERIPPIVTGDGEHSLRQLIAQENARRIAADRFPRLWPIPINTDLKLTLTEQGLNLHSIPPKGKSVPVKTICNGHQGSTVEEATREVHESYLELSRQAMKVCKVRFCGIDIITPDIRQPAGEAGAVINEINTTPSFYGHYQATRQQEVQPVAEKFFKILFENIE
ncbi:MAG: ATP-grasp domain-containing protein, partial [Calditrichia bacterium]